MSFFPIAIQELSPLFRLIDEASRPSTQECAPREPGVPAAVCQRSFERTFHPRFDVMELKNSYELSGELPGVEQKDIKVEWTDGNTLTISGHSESRIKKESPAPSAAPLSTTEKAVEKKPAAESDSYHAPSVEEEDDGEIISKPGESDSETVGSTTEKIAKTTIADPDTSIPNPEVEQPKYWVSERRSGYFGRSFKFPSRIEQENVKASLKNGILSITIPKAVIPAPRTIVVE
ncbi:gb [Venturia nashicola]|uniref:Gb n=1 Tax=Venturia nashicola TaxID=86259 RepID=A0A4Z1PNB6_9PEZI|nr:gb [Venturia nashicola]TLD39442.1 gb [Venturia nashicola]